jgi:ABC-type sugar transport system substrate-binding protein
MVHRRSVWATMVLLAVSALALSGCLAPTGGGGGSGNAAPSAAPTDKKEFNIAIVRWASDDIFFNGVQAGEEQQIKEIEQANGVKINFKVVAANDASAQLDGLRSLVAQGIDGVSLVPWRGESMVAQLKQLEGSNTPVVVHNLTVPGQTAPFVAFDNVAAGALAGTAIVNELKTARGDDWASKGGSIIILRGDVTNSFDRDRFAGYMSVFQPIVDANPQVKIVERANLGYQASPARKAVEDAITSSGVANVLAVGSVDGTMAVGGAIPALKTAGAVVAKGQPNRVAVTSMDCSKPELDSISAGELTHCSEQPAIAEGRIVQNVLFAMMRGGTLTPPDDAAQLSGSEGAPWAPVEVATRDDVAGKWFKTKAFAVPGAVPVDSPFHWATTPGVAGS